MATDTLGRTIPDGSDAPDLDAILRRFSLTSGGIVEVATRTEAEQVRVDANTAADILGVPHRPIVVLRTDIDNIEIHRNQGLTGEGWEYYAGRRHGATVNVSRTAPANTTTELHAQSFARSTAGFTASQGAVVIPATGMYALGYSGRFDGTASMLGRTFVALYVDDAEIVRWPATNEDNYGGGFVYPLSSGSRLMVKAYHSHSGGSSLIVTGQLQITETGAPRW